MNKFVRKGNYFFFIVMFLVILGELIFYSCGSKETTDKSAPLQKVPPSTESSDSVGKDVTEEKTEVAKETGEKVSETKKEDMSGRDLLPISRYPEEGRGFKGQFILVFPEEVFFPPEVFPDEYVKSNPYVKGICECVGNMLMYRALEELPTTEIELCINPALQSKSGKKISSEALCYKVSQKALKVQKSWLEDVTDEYFEIGLTFNEYVIGRDLAQYIRVADFEGDKVDWSLTPSDEKGWMTYKLRVNRSQGDPYKRYKFFIVPGYVDSTGEEKGEGFYLEFPSKESLKVVDCGIKSDGVVWIVFSHPVPKDSLIKNLQIELEGTSEKVKFNTSSGKSSEIYKWYLHLDKSCLSEGQNNFVLTLSPNTWSKDMAILGTTFRKTLKRSEEPIIEPKSSIVETKTSTQFPGLGYRYWSNEGLNGVFYCAQGSALPSVQEVNKHIVIVPEVSNMKVTKEGNWLRIYGDWKTDGRYILKFTAGMKYKTGQIDETSEEEFGVLENDYEIFLDPVPEFKALDFYGKDKFYFIPFGEKNYIRIGGRNVSKVYVHLYRIIPENLSYWVGNISELNQISLDINERTTDYIGAKEVVFNDAVDKTQYLDVNLDELVSKAGKKGLFTIYLSENPNRSEVKFGPSEESWQPYYYEDGTEYGDEYDEGYNWSGWQVSSSIRYFVWTRISIVAHWDEKSVLGFVHDLLDLSPIVGAEVLGYSVKGREVGKTVTDENGVFKFNDIKEEPKVIIVRAVDDFSILLLSPKPLPSLKDLEKYEKFGKDITEAFVYTDRNIYRPGETIHARWIVRKNYGIDLVDAPLELRVINPKNRVVLQKLVNLSDLGTGGEDILTDTSFLTGAYSLGLYIPGGERLCGSTRIHLEDFVPDRIKVESKIESKNWIVGNTYKIGVKANYYVGPPGANLKCEGKVLVYKGDIVSDKWPGYRFVNSEEYLTYLENLSAQFTDEQGQTTYTYEFQPKNLPTCPVEVVIRTEVSEAGGRAVGAVEKAIGYPEDVLCGIGIESEGNKVRANVVLVDTDFNLAEDDDIEVILGTLEWTYVNRVVSTYPRKVLPQWQERFVVNEKKVVRTSSGRAQVEFEIPRGYRNYRIRAKRLSGKMFSDVNFYSMGDRIVSVEEGPPELVKLVVEDRKWNIGEEVPVLIQVPFEGKAFVIIQGEELWESKVVNLIDGKGEFKFEIKPEYFPNVWIAVNAIPAKLEEKSEISPYSSFSFKNIPIDDNSRKLNVEIVGLPESIKPGTKLEFDVLTKGESNDRVPSEITVAIVDEGIHSILGYIKPDPYDWFRRDRYDAILRAHYYENIAYEYNPESPAGDMIARQLSAGKPRISESWIKPFALWSGAVRTNEEGKAHLEFALPEFNGKARVVVIGTSANKFGSAEGSLDVKRPCVIQTQLPRFLRPGDKALIFARGLNTLQNSVIVQGEISSQGGKISRNSIEWEVPANGFEMSPFIEVGSEGVVNCIDLGWRYKVRDRSGTNLDEFSEETKIPVYQTSRYTRDLKTYVIKPGETLCVENSGFEENSLMHSEIWVGGSLGLRVVPVFKWLSSYPYGCAEQKTSKLYAMYIMRKYFLTDELKDANWDDVRLLFASLMSEIFACQHNNGGIGFWQSSSEPDVRVSLHAGFLFASMRRFSDIQIPEKPYIKLMNYIRDLASGSIDDGGGRINEIKVYATMVLAMDGDPVACEKLSGYHLFMGKNISWKLRTLMRYVMSVCKGSIESIPADEVDDVSEEESKEVSVWGFGNTDLLKSSLQLLNALLAGKDDDTILNLQLKVLDLMSSLDSLTTYDLPFVLLALEESTKKFGKPEGNISGDVKINDEVLNVSTANLKKVVDGKVRIEVKNTGESPIYLTTLFGGITISDKKDEKTRNDGVKVNRYIYDRNGVLVNSNEFRQGELYYLVYTILPSNDLEGFVLTQLLPAGVELENPRFYDERFISSLEKIGDNVGSLMKPEHVEIRDDKLIVACPSLKKDSKIGYVCAVRAVTCGEFEFPGFLAEDLYKPNVKSSSPKERIYVK